MPIEIVCASCSTRLRVADEHAGKTVRCSRCKSPISVPVPEVTADDILETDLPLVGRGEDPFEHLDEVDEKVKKRITDELEDDEQIIWTGRPPEEEYKSHPGVMFGIGGVCLALALLALIGTCLLALSSPALGEARTAFWVVGGLITVFLMVMGGAVIAGALMTGNTLARRPVYVLTDRRVLSVEGKELKIAPSTYIAKMRRQDIKGKRGHGMLLIPIKASGYDDARIKFDTIPDVAAVEQLIKDVLIDGKRPA